jgi:hypothetical protein
VPPTETQTSTEASNLGDEPNSEAPVTSTETPIVLPEGGIIAMPEGSSEPSTSSGRSEHQSSPHERQLHLVPSESSTSEQPSVSPSCTERVAAEEQEHQSRRYPRRTRQPSSRLKDHWTFVSENIEEPTNYGEAIKTEDWRDAIKREVDSVITNNTWDIIDRPHDKKAITAKWIFKVKKDGNSHKLKARIVARGFQQQEGVDYEDIFAPVVRWSTIRTVLAIAAKNDWPLHQLDVVTAFLNGNIQEDVIMEIPEGFPGAGDPSKVCKIKRALYGLKQAPKAWHQRIDAWLVSQGLMRSKQDPNLYFGTSNGRKIIILLYVDDLLLTGDDKDRIKQLILALKQEFAMTDLGDARIYHPCHANSVHRRATSQVQLAKLQLQSTPNGSKYITAAQHGNPEY